MASYVRWARCLQIVPAAARLSALSLSCCCCCCFRLSQKPQVFARSKRRVLAEATAAVASLLMIMIQRV